MWDCINCEVIKSKCPNLGSDCVTKLIKEDILLPVAGIRSDGVTFGATLTSLGLGRWSMVFNTPNSNNGGWLYSSGGSEDANRDNPKIILEAGSDTTNGCIIMVTTDDNGAAADPFANNDLSFIVYDVKSVITSIEEECNGSMSINECFCEDELQILQDQVDLIIPTNNIPVADNENDVNLRSGVAGVSLEYSRSDHNHPIIRQNNPGDPVLTYFLSNGSTAPQTIILDRWSDEESFTYEWRVRLDIQPGVGWNYITIPNIVGFQRPEIVITGTYRNTGNPQATSNLAPYMGNEATHWSSTQRIYVGPFSKTAFARYYVGVKVKYTRT